jgi:signal transduction histidine kinase
VRIADQGPGVPSTERERVFDPFVSGGDTTGTGTGLGLSIARAIVEAHGGRVWIEGAPGGGTAVTFDLPTST